MDKTMAEQQQASTAMARVFEWLVYWICTLLVLICNLIGFLKSVTAPLLGLWPSGPSADAAATALGDMEVCKASGEQLLTLMGPSPWPQPQQQVAAALAATGSIRPLKRLGAGACGEVFECSIESASSVPGTSTTAPSFRAAVKLIPFQHCVTTSSSSSSNSTLIFPDTNTPQLVVQEMIANQAVASSPQLFAAYFGARICAAGALLVFQLVGVGASLGTAVALPAAGEGQQQGVPAAAPAAAAPPAGASLPPRLMDYLLRFLVTASHQLHRQGYVNLDIKPANTLLTSQGQPLMSDLGTAVPRGRVVSGVGTPLYCAPQLAQDDIQVPAHPALDYWSIVITLIALNAGDDIRRTAAAARLAAALAHPSPARKIPSPTGSNSNLNLNPDTSLMVTQEEKPKEEEEAGGVAALRQHLLVEAGLDPDLVELLLVLLQYCLAAVAPVGGAPPLVNPGLANLDPYGAVVAYLAGRGIAELAPGEDPLPADALSQLLDLPGAAAATKQQQQQDATTAAAAASTSPDAMGLEDLLRWLAAGGATPAVSAVTAAPAATTNNNPSSSSSCNKRGDGLGARLCRLLSLKGWRNRDAACTAATVAGGSSRSNRTTQSSSSSGGGWGSARPSAGGNVAAAVAAVQQVVVVGAAGGGSQGAGNSSSVIASTSTSSSSSNGTSVQSRRCNSSSMSGRGSAHVLCLLEDDTLSAAVSSDTAVTPGDDVEVTVVLAPSKGMGQVASGATTTSSGSKAVGAGDSSDIDVSSNLSRDAMRVAAGGKTSSSGSSRGGGEGGKRRPLLLRAGHKVAKRLVAAWEWVGV